MGEQDLKNIGESIGVKVEEKGKKPRVTQYEDAKKMPRKKLETEVRQWRNAERKRQREHKEQPEAEVSAEQDLMGEAEVGGFIGWIVNSWIAERLGSHWVLTDLEIIKAGHECAPFVNKYAPYASKWQEELRAGFWVFATFGPRWQKTQELRDRMKAEQKKGEAQPLEKVKEGMDGNLNRGQEQQRGSGQV